MKRQSSDLGIGDTFALRVVENLTRTQIVQYAGASGDYNPIHTDEVYATQVAGYPSVFAHGMLTMALTARVLTDRFGADALTRLGARFTAQVWPGDTLDTIATVSGISTDNGMRLIDVELETTNQNGATVMKGYGQARA